MIYKLVMLGIPESRWRSLRNEIAERLSTPLS